MLPLLDWMRQVVPLHKSQVEELSLYNVSVLDGSSLLHFLGPPAKEKPITPGPKQSFSGKNQTGTMDLQGPSVLHTQDTRAYLGIAKTR